MTDRTTDRTKVRTLVTGVSGFIGGELAGRLLADGHHVRGLSRNPDRVTFDLPVVRGDAATGEGLDEALHEVDVAYYLIHSLESGNPEGFAARDRRAVANFVAAAERARTRRLVYLGINHPPPGPTLSAHLASRFEVEERLQAASIDTVSVRANFIVSARNPQFRHLMATAELAVIALPPGHEAKLSPLDSRDVIACLVAAAAASTQPGTYEIGGPEVLTFGELLPRIATAMGLEPEVVAGQLRPEDVTAELMHSISGIDPAYIGPLLDTARIDLVPEVNQIAALGVTTPVPLDDALHHALLGVGGAPQPLEA